MNTSARRVTLSTTTVGQSFSTVGTVRDAKTGRKLASTDARPFGFTSAALAAAEKLATAKGWTIVEAD